MKITKNKRQLVLISCLSGSLLASLAIFSFKKPATIKNEIGETNLQNASVTEEEGSKKESKTPEDLREMNEENIAKLSKYDSRDYGIVTPVKDQGFEGLCWAYALASASETSILREGILDDEINDKNEGGVSDNKNKKYDNKSLILSPASIDWVSNVRWGNADKLGLTPNDTFSRSLRSGFGIGRSAIAVMQWGAPTMMHERYESYDKQVAKLENIVQVIGEDSEVPNVDEVKKLVAKYGAVAFGYSFSGGSHGDYFNGSKNNAGGCSTSHHAATIVGWDDTVKKEQFSPQSSTDGAWIVKNSWGKDRFKEGYFYMSYDSRATDMVAVDYAANKDYQHNYYYDGLNLGIYPLSTSTDTHKYNELAAVFPALKGTPAEKEHLKGVNVSFKGKNVKVEVKVYKDPNPKNGSLDDISPELGQSKEVWSKTETFDHPGSYTLKVEDGKKIELERDSYFSAVVKVTNEKNDAEVLVSQEFTYSNDLTYYKDADGKWKNCWDKNKSVARIKAFTTTEKVTSAAEDSKNVKYADVRFADYFYRYGDPLTDINPIVKVNGKNLVAKTDYDVSYVVYDSGVKNTFYNEASVGQVKVTITGKGEYKGTTVKYVDMKVGLRPDLGSIGWYTENNKVIINDNDKKGKKYSEITLPSGWEFVNKDYVIGGISNNHLRYVGSDSNLYRTTYFDVVSVGSGNSYKKDISQAAITTSKSDAAATPNVKVSMTGVNSELQKDVDYDVDYFNIEHDCVRITITGKGNYSGKKEMVFATKSDPNQTVGMYQEIDKNRTIVKRSLSGQEKESGKKIVSPKKVTESVVHQPVAESERENVKRAEEIVQKPVETKQVNTQDSTETKNRQKRDVPSNTKDISKATVSITSNGDVIYDGKEKQPEVKVQLHSTTLTKDVDYKVNYKDNINAGLASIEIVGINGYSGTSFASFNIKKATPKVSALGVDSKGQVVAKTNTGDGNIVYKYYTDESCTKEVTNPTKSGWYYVKTYVPETRNYSSYESTPSRVQLDSEKMMFNLQALTTNNFGNATKSNKLVIALSSVCAALVIAILVAIPLLVKKFKSRKG